MLFLGAEQKYGTAVWKLVNILIKIGYSCTLSVRLSFQIKKYNETGISLGHTPPLPKNHQNSISSPSKVKVLRLLMNYDGQ